MDKALDQLVLTEEFTAGCTISTSAGEVACNGSAGSSGKHLNRHDVHARPPGEYIHITIPLSAVKKNMCDGREGDSRRRRTLQVARFQTKKRLSR